MIEFDNILNELDCMTRPQWIQLLLLTLPCLIVPMHMGGMVFLGAEPQHTCSLPLREDMEQTCGQNWTDEQTAKYIPWNDDSESLDSCTRYVINETSCNYWWPNATFDMNQSSVTETEGCSSWIYNTSMFETTVVSEFDLVCGERYKTRLSQAVYMLGVTLGCAVWGQMSDRYGRKLGIVGPLLIGFIFAICAAFSQSFAVFTAMRFFVGFSLFPAFSCVFVLGTETVKPNYRVWVGQSAQAFFALGFCLLALLGYFIRNWRTLQLYISVPIIAVVLILWFLFESPRWLISSKKYIVADRIVKRIIKSKKNLRSNEAKKLENMATLQNVNKTLDKNSDLDKLTTVEEKNEENQTKIKKNYTILDVLRLPNMRKKSIILFYEWMVASSMYYGLTLNAADLGGDPFINLFLSGLVEVPASYLAVLLLEKMGRRPTLVCTSFLGGIACMCMMFVPKGLLWLNITLSMLGKFSAAAAFGTVYIYAAEIYPTPVRNVGLGVCSSWARIGGMLSPFIAMLDAVGKPIPYVVFGLLSMIGGLLGLLLPEVLGIKLPETLEEGEAFGKINITNMARMCCHKASERCHDKSGEKEQYDCMMTTDPISTTKTDLDSIA